MRIEDITVIVDAWWPILMAIGGVVIHQVIPFIRTRIFKYNCDNVYGTFLLLEYELFGVIAAAILALIATLICGKSTWEYVYLKEYGIALIGMILPYAFGIVIIVKHKMEKEYRKYVKNMLLGALIYFFILFPYYAEEIVEYSLIIKIGFRVSMIFLLVAQGKMNIKFELIKSVKYVVLVDGKRYISKYEPMKRGNYFFVTITDKDDKDIKRIQIPEDKILRIEYIIEYIKKGETEMGEKC